MSTPRLSVLIPNYNNGRASSVDGSIDLLGDLLLSLQETLRDDPTPLEILAFDDGSTDDSLQTLEDWAQRTWTEGSARAGQPFLTMMQAPHCGVLSITANKLVRAARGDILARLDGDIVCLTPNWAEKLTAAFDAAPPQLGVIGPKQLGLDGKIHSFGDWLLHPQGYHHIAQNLPRNAVNKAVACDHVMGCFYGFRREVFDTLGGFDESFLRGQTVDFGIGSLHAGYRCMAVPHIEFVHRHSARASRKTTADTKAGIDASLQTFRDKWGFDRLAPDLDVVRDRYAGTGLLWNPEVFGTPAASAELVRTPDPESPSDSQWAQFGSDLAVRQDLETIASVALSLHESQLGGRGAVGVVGCGSGVWAHLLASRGIEVIACDRSAKHISIANLFAEKQRYPGPTPKYLHQDHPRELPMPGGWARLVVLHDAMEKSDNPAGLIRRAQELLTPDGCLAVILDPTPREPVPWMPQQNRFTPGTAAAMIRHVTGFPVQQATANHPGRPNVPLVVLIGQAPAPTPVQPPVQTVVPPRPPVHKATEPKASPTPVA